MTWMIGLFIPQPSPTPPFPKKNHETSISFSRNSAQQEKSGCTPGSSQLPHGDSGILFGRKNYEKLAPGKLVSKDKS